MPQHPVLDAIKQRRSIRKFTDQTVDASALLDILEAGRWAPSGKNYQPCRFLAVRSGDPREDVLAKHTKYAHIIHNASANICVFLEKARCYDVTKDHQSAGAAIQNMLLATHALGLGAVWIGQIINQEPEVTRDLGLDPEALELQAVIALGHPDQQPEGTRQPLEDHLLESL